MPDELRGKLPDELVDELLAGAKTEEEIVGAGGLLSQLTRRLVELTDHLGYERHQEPAGGAGNTRNGSTPKTLVTEHGPVERHACVPGMAIATIPCERAATLSAGPSTSRILRVPGLVPEDALEVLGRVADCDRQPAAGLETDLKLADRP